MSKVTDGTKVAIHENLSPDKFYMAAKTFGGEYLWLERITKHFGSTISYIWPREKKTPDLPSVGLSNRLLILFSRIIPNGRGVFMNILIAHYRFPSDSKVFISTPYYPIPKNTDIAYIHTPSRFLTVDFDKVYEKGIVKRTAWKLFRHFYVKAYCGSLNNARKVYINSKYTKNRLDKMCGFVTDIEVAYPTLQVKEYRNKQAKPYFFYPSRFTEQKNQIFVVQAYELLLKNLEKADNGENPPDLILAGSSPVQSGENWKYFSDLKENADRINKKHGTRIKFIFDPDHEEMIKLYSECLCVLYAAKNEDFGFVPVEGMAASKPVIGLNEGGIRESIVNEKTGFSVNTPVEMEEKMMYILLNKERATEMGLEGRKTARKFDERTFFKKILKD